MISETSKCVADQARLLYATKLQKRLESQEAGRFVSIEPASGHYFLGDTLDDAVNAAVDAFPDRLTYTIRIGHAAALHLGVLSL